LNSTQSLVEETRCLGSTLVDKTKMNDDLQILTPKILNSIKRLD